MPVDPSILVAFALACGAVYVAPGVDMAYIASNAIGRGRRAGLWAAAGTACGVSIQALAAALGMTALFAASPVLFEAVRWVGVAYLVWLGIVTLRSGDGPSSGAPDGPADWRPWPVLVKGATINLLNPKVALFFLAFLPQFVDGDGAPVAAQLGFLGALFSLGALAWCASLALAFSGLGARVGDSPRFARWQRRVSGGSYIAFAGLLGLADLRR